MRNITILLLFLTSLSAFSEPADDHPARRNTVIQAMQKVMGPIPGDDRKVPFDLRVEESTELDGLVRRKITFAVEKDDRISAYLIVPKNLKGKVPAVLCLHQTTAIGKGSPAGLGDKPELHYAVHLAQRGYVTLSPDYPYFGDSKNADPYKQGYVSGTMKGIWNHMRCVDLLSAMEGVDADRIGCMGHSLGGHNTLFLAAFDPRIMVAVTNCGFNSFHKYYNGNLTGWSSNKYMPRIATEYGKDPKKMPFDFGDVLSAIAPRAVLAIAPLKDANFEVSGVRDCITIAAPMYEKLGAPDKLVAIYPDCAHELPKESRAKAYQFLDDALKSK